jgi:tetratricopeptide (TPR) repeat protein
VVKAGPGGPLDDVERSFPGTTELLGAMAFMAAAPLPWRQVETLARSLAPAVADALADPEQRGALLTALTDAGHLSADERSGAITDVSAVTIRRRLTAAEGGRYRQAALALLLDSFPEDAELPIHWPLCQVLAAHVIAVYQHTEQTREANTLLARLALYELSKGHPATSMELARRVIDAARALDDREVLGLALHALGRALCEDGDSEQSSIELERALEIHREILPPRAVTTRMDEYMLAYVLGDLGEYTRALGYLQQLDTEVAEHPDRHHCRALKIRGTIRLQAEQDEDADTDFMASLALAERILGDGDPEFAEAHNGAAVAKRRKGELDLALEHAETAVERGVAVLGPDHPDVAVFRSALADVLFDLNELPRAREELELSLANGEAMLSGNHRGLWIRHTKLANLLQRTGELALARQHGEAALAVSERAHGSESREVADDLARLTQTLLRLGEFSAARDSAVRALAIRQASDATDRRLLALAESSLGAALIGLGELPRAREHLKAALAIQQAEAGPRDPSTLTMSLELHMLLARMGQELSAAHRALGQEVQADAFAEHTRAAYVQALQPMLDGDTPGVLLSLAGYSASIAPELAQSALERAGQADEETPATRMRLAGAWHQLGRARAARSESAEAEHAFAEALPLLEHEPQRAGVVLHDMADLRLAAEEREQAADLYRRAAERKREAGERTNVRDLATTLHALGRTLEATGALDEALAAYTDRLDLLRTLPEQDHVAESVVLRDIGDVHRARDELARAIESYELALHHAEECVDNRATDRKLELLRALASTHIKAADPLRAVATLRARQEILESLHERRPTEEAYTINTIGTMLAMLGDIEQALRCFERAWELQSQVETPERPEDPIGLAVTLLGAALARGVGSPDSATLAREAAALVRPLDTRNPYLFVSALALQAAAVARNGETEEAERLLAEADEALPKTVETPNLEVVNPILILGDVHKRAGHERRAAQLREQALDLLERMVADQTIPPTELLTVVASCLEAGATDLAEQALEDARQAAEGDPQLRHMLARSLSRVGRAYELQLRDYEQALARYQESLSVLRSLEQSDPGSESTTLRDLGDVHRQRNEFTEAIECYQGSLARAEEVADERGVASTLLGLGRALIASGRLDEALEAFQRRVEILRGRERPELQAIGVTLHDIAGIHERRSELSEAIRLYRKAAELKQKADSPKRDQITTLLQLARVQVAAEDPDAAQSTRKVLELLLGETPRDERRLAKALLLEARLALAAGEAERALELLGEAEGLSIEDAARTELDAFTADARALISGA